MYIDREDFIAWMERIIDRFDMQDKKIDRVINVRNCLDGEELLDNQDLCLLLKVAPRTLTRYRKKGILPFLMLDGRCYYRATWKNRFILPP
ncbi:DNA-binding protein [Bacteroides thetaiotaomicron]|uniref:DNA-binding protein n=1 Tax=Bacteroides thetaiotaomicron TaxID=818 RepID=UPI003563A25E